MLLRAIPLFVGILCGVVLSAQSSTPDIADLKLRAERGDAVAANAYAESCFNRFYFSESERWFQAAAEAGLTNAQWRLGEMLLHGKTFLNRSVKARPTEGFRWLFHAALQGHREAQWEVGRALHDGVGVKSDQNHALYWLMIAANSGHIMAGVYRDQLVTKLPTADVQPVKQRAAAFRPVPRDVKEVVWDAIKLKGISGTASRRIGLINELTLGEGETGAVRVGARSHRVRCLQITADSAVVELLDFGDKRQLRLE
jgi:hypothetical protein